jgi:integrase
MKIRRKNRTDHRVPLSPRAIAILQSMPQGEADDYVFPGGRRGHPLSDMALLECLRDLRDAVTVHGFRAAFSTWRGEVTSFPKELAEFQLAHIIGDQAEAAYQRSDLFERRRELMLVWDRYCTGERTDVLKLEQRR